MIRPINELNIFNLNDIIALYPNDYILVKAVTVNHKKGIESGIPICRCSDEQELREFRDRDPAIADTEILMGINLIPTACNVE